MKKVFISVLLTMTAITAQAQEVMVMSCSVYRGHDLTDMTGYVVAQNETTTKVYSIEQGQIKNEYADVQIETSKFDQVSDRVARNLKEKLSKSVLRKTDYVKVLDLSMIHKGKLLVNVYDKDHNNLGGVVINQNWFERKCHPLVKESIYGFLQDHNARYLFGN